MEMCLSQSTQSIPWAQGLVPIQGLQHLITMGQASQHMLTQVSLPGHLWVSQRHQHQRSNSPAKPWKRDTKWAFEGDVGEEAEDEDEGQNGGPPPWPFPPPAWPIHLWGGLPPPPVWSSDPWTWKLIWLQVRLLWLWTLLHGTIGCILKLLDPSRAVCRSRTSSKTRALESGAIHFLHVRIIHKTCPSSCSITISGFQKHPAGPETVLIGVHILSKKGGFATVPSWFLMLETLQNLRRVFAFSPSSLQRMHRFQLAASILVNASPLPSSSIHHQEVTFGTQVAGNWLFNLIPEISAA